MNQRLTARQITYQRVTIYRVILDGNERNIIITGYPLHEDEHGYDNQLYKVTYDFEAVKKLFEDVRLSDPAVHHYIDSSCKQLHFLAFLRTLKLEVLPEDDIVFTIAQGMTVDVDPEIFNHSYNLAIRLGYLDHKTVEKDIIRNFAMNVFKDKTKINNLVLFMESKLFEEAQF